MYGDSVIAEEVLDKVKAALLNGDNWMAYNNSLYFIDKNEVQFFSDKGSAAEFATNNFSEYDHYTVMYVSSVADLLQKVQPQVDIEDLEKEMQRFDWAQTFYDPLEANTEAETMDDREAFNRLEQLIKNLRQVYKYSAYGKQLVERLTQKYWAGNNSRTRFIKPKNKCYERGKCKVFER